MSAPGWEKKLDVMVRHEEVNKRICEGSKSATKKLAAIMGVRVDRAPSRRMYLPSSPLDRCRAYYRTNFWHLVDRHYLPKMILGPDMRVETTRRDIKINQAMRGVIVRKANHDRKFFELLSKQSTNFIRQLLTNNLEHIKYGSYPATSDRDKQLAFKKIQRAVATNRKSLRRPQRAALFEILALYLTRKREHIPKDIVLAKCDQDDVIVIPSNYARPLPASRMLEPVKRLSDGWGYGDKQDRKSVV